MTLVKNHVPNKTLEILQYLFFVILLLYWGRSLFIPFSIGLLISFILYPICGWFEKRNVSHSIAILISLLLFFLLSAVLIALAVYQLLEFIQQWPELKTKLTTLAADLDTRISGNWLKMFINEDTGLLGSAVNYLSVHILPGIPKALYDSSVSMVLFILIPIYAALILFYRKVLVAFVYSILPKESHHYFGKLLPQVILTYYNFIKGVGIVYLAVGILNSLGLFLLGVPNPVFFGFVASILTFIPYIGITVGAILPMAVSWLHYDSLFYPLGVIGVFGIVQLLEANIIFPLAVSQKLQINALITLITIITGGIIWGAMGMILFLPFVAILKLVADKVDRLKAISVLLGTKNALV